MELANLRQTHFPYCLERLPNGRYVLLNRKYKPVGFTVPSSTWINYEEHPISCQIKMTPKKAAQLSHEGSENVECIYLYNDDTNPENGRSCLEAYLGRLALLFGFNWWINDDE